MMVKRICILIKILISWYLAVMRKSSSYFILSAGANHQRNMPHFCIFFLILQRLAQCLLRSFAFYSEIPTIILFLFPFFIFILKQRLFLYVHPIFCAIKYIRTLCSTSFACECIFHVVINISFWFQETTFSKIIAQGGATQHNNG